MNSLSGVRRLRKLRWQDIRDDVINSDPDLAVIIDAIDPSDELSLIEATYLYGDLVVKDGQLTLLSCSDDFFVTDHHSCLADIRYILSYQAIPLFLTLENDNEVFIHTHSRVVPLNLFRAGSLLGLFESMDTIFNTASYPLWSVAAGARSIIMLPKISDSHHFKKLSSYYDIPITTRLKYFVDHWEVFRLIATHKNFTQAWKNRVLFFSREWLSEDFLKKNPEFANYLFAKSWNQVKFAMSKLNASLVWELFSEAISVRNLSPRPYLADQVKHLLSIAEKRSNGLQIADESQTVAPINGIERAITDIYELKKYMPIIMYSSSLSETSYERARYYSLCYSTILEGSPLNKSSSSIIADVLELKLLVDTFRNYAARYGKLSTLFRDTVIEYIHSSDTNTTGILSSKKLCTLATPELRRYQQLYPSREFPYTSAFWNGCIRLTVNLSST